MYKIAIELNDTELRIISGNDILLPLKISGWNFESDDFEYQLEQGLRDFILDFVKGYKNSGIEDGSTH